MKTYLEVDYNLNTIYQNIWNASKQCLWGNLKLLTNRKKKKNLKKIPKLIFHLKKLGKMLNEIQRSEKKEVIWIRVRI